MTAPASKKDQVTRIDFRRIAQALADRAEDVCQHLWPNGKRDGTNWCVGDVHGSAPTNHGSFRVCLSGSKAGVCKDFSTDEKAFDLLDGWAKSRGISVSKAAHEAAAYLGFSVGHPPVPASPKPKSTPKKAARLKRFNPEHNQRLRKRLWDNAAALEYLRGRGLEDSTIEEFRLGLSTPYTTTDGVVRQDALTYPVRLRDGTFASKYGYYTVPGVTQDPIDQNGWMKGSPLCYYAQKSHRHTAIFVCEGIKDVWRHWQALQEAGLADDILLVSSTHGAGLPEAWKDPDFWAQWDQVYMGQDNDEAGDQMAERILEHAGREVLRARVPEDRGKDWTDFWNNGGSVEQFQELLDDASPVVNPIQRDTGNPLQTGRLSFKPVDINNAYLNGHLYYPTEILRRSWMEDDNGETKLAEWAETVVVRSDRTDWSITQAFAPSNIGNSLGRRRLLKLTDGTILARQPKPSAYNTWEWSYIQDFLEGREKVRPIDEIVSEIHQILRRAVWLPYEEDYAVLALMIPVTYVQRVFEAVPLFLLNGPAGSGKTQMANTVAKMCCNGNVIGQMSAATAARHIDDCRGFVVLDDLEAIGSKGGKDAAQFNELVQALKVSYNQNSAVKIWTDVKTMRTEKLDFFGVKMINNTLGTDAILGSRMIKIQTRKVPEGYESELEDLTAEVDLRMHEIRQELHTWAFANVGQVDERYQQQYRHHSERSEEIAAPLRVMADLVGDQTLKTHLESALSRQSVQLDDPDDPTEVLREAVRNLIRNGYDTVTLTHISLEMRSLLDANFGKGMTNEIPEWSRPEWVGRRLRNEDLVEPRQKGRRRFFGRNLRLVQLAGWLIDEVQKELEEAGQSPEIGTRDSADFCRGCEACPYRNAGCELMEARAQHEGKRRKTAH